MRISDNLNLAADHIEEFGHYKDEGHGPGNYLTAPACAIGAINIAHYKATGEDTWDFQGASAALGRYLGESVVLWNDAPDRTADEVVAALRACALVEAAKESESRSPYCSCGAELCSDGGRVA